ncbi:hypothetical protein [Actinomadura napierensis]|uniref:Uncharacterized protein n=1 Tax=Actinomadura napierensis TaxID=267854 RepID=A0ABP5KFT7_9ACTN
MIAAGVHSPWAATQIDPDVVLAEVRRLYPGVTAWAGEFTGSYWVLLDGELREFKDPHGLIACIRLRLALARPEPLELPERIGNPPAAPCSCRRSGVPAPLDRPEESWRRLIRAVRRLFAGGETASAFRV